MNISQQKKEEILRASEGQLLKVVGDFVELHKSGQSQIGKCPVCQNERGLVVTPNKDGGLFRCFHCNELSGKKPIDFLMKGKNMSFPEALEHLAKTFFIELEELVQKPKPARKLKPTKAAQRMDQLEESFCSRMLAESGLTYEDLEFKGWRTSDNSLEVDIRPFQPGTIDDTWKISYRKENPNADDVVISYFNLDGYPVTYDLKLGRGDKTIKKEYLRIRWQFAHEHQVDGKDTKYRTPKGGGTPIYIPQRIRTAYMDKTKIDRLYIQEGEKKAEKACKHGLMSVAISGIQNIAYNGSLPEDLIRIIQACQVKEVCFLLDGDWNDLSSNLKINDSVDRRPRCFFSAVKNYKEYMRTLVNRNIYVEIYFGYVLPNDNHDKGIDDLLSNTLLGKEEELSSDLDVLINTKELKGKFLQLHKITTMSDQRLEEFWSLNSARKFADTHKEILIEYPEFKIGRHKWRFDVEGNLVSAQPLELDEQYWEEVQKARRDGSQYTEYEFRYVESQVFLQNRGFGRYRLLDGKEAYVHLDSPTVKMIDPNEARDYLFGFTKEWCNKKVLELLIRGVSQYVGPDKLKLLNFIQPNFIKPVRDTQYFYFKNSCWKVTVDGIEDFDYTQVRHHIWAEQRKDFPAVKTSELLSVDREEKTGAFTYKFSTEGEKCHFLKFLENTSNFSWRKEKMIEEQKNNKSDSTEPVIITDDEIMENRQHFISKLCAIGFLLMECKDPSRAKAVIAMDGKQSAVGDSNGRSGKSLVGELLKNVLKTAAVNGKKRDMESDQFIWNDVDEATKIVFIDDVRQGFVFEDLFFCITGDWSVNYKGGRRMTIPFDSSPKIYMTTNHAIKGSDDSHKDRQYLIAFCDYYNATHKPIEDFGIRFFSDWDFDQWNLCWNMLGMCIQLYLRYGVVEAPNERLEQRQLRQEITEDFIAWADEYFSDEKNLNCKQKRKDLTDKFFEYAPMQRKYITATEFKKKIIKYCKWKGYLFNPQRYDRVTGKPIYFDSDGRPDVDDKSGGLEYFTLGNSNFLITDEYSAKPEPEEIPAGDENELKF